MYLENNHQRDYFFYCPGDLLGKRLLEAGIPTEFKI